MKDDQGNKLPQSLVDFINTLGIDEHGHTNRGNYKHKETEPDF